jgi:hypothetical protein
MEKFFPSSAQRKAERGQLWDALPPWLCLGWSLLRLVQIEDAPCSVEIDDSTVDDHLVFAGVRRNVVKIFNGVAVSPQFPNDEVDVYHMAG